MRYAQIRSLDIANGKGMRVSVFVQGCDFHCKDCFNVDTWNWTGGNEWTLEKEDLVLNLCKNERIRGLSILGGEPLHPKNIKAVTELAKHFKMLYPNKDLWIWSGYEWESYIKDQEIVEYADVIVDGKFDCTKKNLSLQFRGSSNQRVIDVKETLKKKEVILYL